MQWLFSNYVLKRTQQQRFLSLEISLSPLGHVTTYSWNGLMLVTLVVFKGREAEITQFFFMRLSRICIDNTFCKKIGRDRFIPAWAARMANYLVWPTSWPGTVCKVWTLKPRRINIVTLPFCPRHDISYTSTNTRSIWYPASWNPFWQLNYGLTTLLAGPWRPWCDKNQWISTWSPHYHENMGNHAHTWAW